MENINKELLTLLGTEAFTNLVNNKNLKIVELEAIMSLLIKTHIPFDITYSPGTRRLAAAAQLTIWLNPSTSIVIDINLQGGNSVFSGGSS